MRKRFLAGTLGSILALVAFAALPSPAAGSSLAYVDQKEVWVSTPDGNSKVRLSSGENEWRSVAASDGGKLMGVRLEEGKIFQLSRMQLWGKDGKVVSQGPLPYDNMAW
ncbi:MAG: hypothetical protein M3Y23_04800, partial [Actinomycetota bacterium]|nr:hypothetical protein [Actinomycetota bacterium]